MKVLLINGSPHKNGCTNRALTEITTEFQKENIDFEIFHVGNEAVRGCAYCGYCGRSGGNHCVFKDDVVNTIIDKIVESDAVIIGAPVYYANVCGNLRPVLDRVFFAGQCNSSSFAGKLGASVVNCRRGGASATFDQLNHYFSISNMHIVGSQYWNQTHGHTPEQVEKDEEGLQTMRTLGKNMAYLLKCLEAGEKAGIKKPEYEPNIYTNFIN